MEGGGGLDQVEGGRGLGSVRFGVSYERETERLTVTLVRARNLPSRNPGTANACDPFVRCVGTAVSLHCSSNYHRSTIRILRIFFIFKIQRILRIFSVEKNSQKIVILQIIDV